MLEPYKVAQFHQCWPVADALLTLSQKDNTSDRDTLKKKKTDRNKRALSTRQEQQAGL